MSPNFISGGDDGEGGTGGNCADLRYCQCADPENCREVIPGYVCRKGGASPDEWHLKHARRCPTCDSPQPHLHPAMQHEGEVQPCRDPWHSLAKVTHD